MSTDVPIELRVQGVRFNHWTSLEVTASIEQACRTFSLECIRQEGEPTVPIPLDADCELWLAGKKVVTGVVGKVQSIRNGDTNRLSCSGRSKTRDAVDCTADHPGRWNNRTVKQIADDLCEPHGIEVVNEAADTTRLPRFALEDGESIYSAIERAARERSLLLTDDADGRLVLTRAGTVKAGTIERSQNILASDVSGDSEGLYSEIRCEGVRAGDDVNFGASLFAESTAFDDGPRRHRLLVIKPEGRADTAACQARARWEVASRYGKSIALRYEVPEWTRDDGELWTPNVQTRVIDPTEYVDGRFLLVSVTFRLTGNEFRSSLELSPVEAFQPLELPTLRTRGKKSAPAYGINDAETITPTVRKAGASIRSDSGRKAAR